MKVSPVPNYSTGADFTGQSQCPSQHPADCPEHSRTFICRTLFNFLRNSDVRIILTSHGDPHQDKEDRIVTIHTERDLSLQTKSDLIFPIWEN